VEINETLRTDPADQGARQKKKEDDQAIVSAISASSVDFGLIHAFQKGFVSHQYFLAQINTLGAKLSYWISQLIFLICWITR